MLLFELHINIGRVSLEVTNDFADKSRLDVVLERVVTSAPELHNLGVDDRRQVCRSELAAVLDLALVQPEAIAPLLSIVVRR